MFKESLILVLLFLLSSNSIYAQYSLDFIWGTRIHTDRMEDLNSAGPSKTLTSLLVGVNLKHKKKPITLSYQKSYIQSFTNFAPGFMTVQQFGAILETWEEDQIHIYYNLKKYRIGIGHYWRKRENEGSFAGFGNPFLRRKGVQLSFSIPTKWIEIELRSKIQYDPSFSAIFGSAHYALLFTQRIGKKNTTDSYSSFDFLTINGIVGIRVFPINIELLPGETLNKPFGFAPTLGLEFLFKKFNLSLNLEKDWWNSFNGGSTVRPVKGLVYNSFIGIKYHQMLKNGRHLRYGIGGSWIEDDENKIKNITLTPTPEQQKLGNFQVKGIGLTLSYEVLKNIDLELKTTLPFLGEKIFENRSRTSIGLLYRYNPKD